MFLLDETHPSSVCSQFASRPAKPSHRRESRQWEWIKTLMLSAASVKKWAFWFICCVGISNKHQILFWAEPVSELPCHWGSTGEMGGRTVSVVVTSQHHWGLSLAWLWGEHDTHPRPVPGLCLWAAGM